MPCGLPQPAQGHGEGRPGHRWRGEDPPSCSSPQQLNANEPATTIQARGSRAEEIQRALDRYPTAPRCGEEGRFLPRETCGQSHSLPRTADLPSPPAQTEQGQPQPHQPCQVTWQLRAQHNPGVPTLCPTCNALCPRDAMLSLLLWEHPGLLDSLP